MSIREFHLQLFTGAQEGLLFGALRKLASLSDPTQMASDEVSSGWIVWGDPRNAGKGAVLACVG
jgi:hypothetical protein